MGYYCMICDCYYAEPTADFICRDVSCAGEGVTGILIDEKVFQPEDRLVERDNNLARAGAGRVLTIGRAEDNDISLPNGQVSRYHAEIYIDSFQGLKVRDLNSTGGTFVNGRRVRQSRLQMTDVIKVAQQVVAWQAYFADEVNTEVLHTITIGRRNDCDVVMPWTDVGRIHATLTISKDGKVTIHDEKSKNGVFVNGARISSSQSLHQADTVLIANKYKLDWTALSNNLHN